MSRNGAPFVSYRKQLDEVANPSDEIIVRDCSYEAALIMVKKFIQDKKLRNDDIIYDGAKDKDYLKVKKEKCRTYVKEIIHEHKLRVDGYIDGSKELVNELVEDIVGRSILEDAFNDDEITDIFINEYNNIIVEKAGLNMKYWRSFRSETHYLETINRFLTEAGKELNDGDKKIVHFDLYGDRGCATSKKVSTRQVSSTFRKHGYSTIVKDDLVNKNILTEDMADLLGILIKGEQNVVIAGLTGSGKTTTFQSLLNAYLGKKRLLVCEDTQELSIEGDNILQLASFVGKTKEETVDLYDIIITALRLKPRLIAVGEVRGREALAAIECAETGHGTWMTMHGSKPINIINRLVTKYLMAMPSLGIDVVERIIGSAIDYICVQDAIPGVGRKVTTICEVSYNFETRRVETREIYKYDFEKEEFVKIGDIGHDKVETMYRRGVKKIEIERWIS